MQRFTADRRAGTAAELWLVEHPPVFTLGQAGRERHLLDPGDIPVVRSDRGGQVTYHGPGQLVCYLLLDLQARGIGIRTLVSGIETALMALLVVLHGVRAIDRSLDWRSENGLYVHDLEVNPRSAKIQSNAGAAFAEMERHERALRCWGSDCEGSHSRSGSCRTGRQRATKGARSLMSERNP